MYFIVRPQYKKGATIDPVLNNNSWATIQKAAQDGVASQYWNVGDRKAVTLNGQVGDFKTFSNQTVYVYILGFNHNASVEGNNTIHFQFAFDALTDGINIAFIDAQYTASVSSTNAFRMNTSQTNSGGWKNSYMRNTLVPQFINAMPSDLQAVLKNVNKYTDNGTGSSHQSSSDITSTSDKVFLLSEYEIFGARTYANQYEQNSQLQYDYYKNGNDTKKYNENNKQYTAYYFTRSPYCLNEKRFCSILSGASYSQANESRGLAPAFVVG